MEWECDKWYIKMYTTSGLEVSKQALFVWSTFLQQRTFKERGKMFFLVFLFLLRNSETCSKGKNSSGIYNTIIQWESV
jgi:hypothetical protein